MALKMWKRRNGALKRMKVAVGMIASHQWSKRSRMTHIHIPAPMWMILRVRT